MDIHKPKAVHGWREFANEIGVIVCGVLIALTGEQIVENLHWRHKIHQTEAALRLELLEDNAPQAYTRLAVAGCYDQRLAAILAAAQTGDRAQVTALVRSYAPASYSWDSEAWRATLASDVGSHTSANQMILWSAPYRLTPNLGAYNDQEGATLADLQIGAGPQPLSAEERSRLVRAVYTLRRLNDLIRRRSRTFLRSLLDLDMEIAPDEQARLMALVRTSVGSCAMVPNYRHYSPYDQANAYAPDTASPPREPAR